MEIVLIILIAVAVIGMSAIVFCIWAAVSVGRFIWQLLFRNSSPALIDTDGNKYCSNVQCACVNSVQARFCRRCGRVLPGTVQWTGDLTRVA
jgi:hypothetical protein